MRAFAEAFPSERIDHALCVVFYFRCMQKCLLILCMVVGAHAIGQQSETCEADILYAVHTPSGLKLRSGPSTKAEHLVTVPQDSVVLACKKTFGTLEVGDTQGYWRSVRYKQYEGFMFDGYLRPLLASSPDSISLAAEDGASNDAARPLAPSSFTLAMETYNYCGNYDQLDPSLHWYGIYPPENGKSAFSLQGIRLELVLLGKNEAGIMEFDVRTDREEKSLFLIGTDQQLERGDLLYLSSAWQNELPVLLHPGKETKVFARSVAEDPKNLHVQAFGGVMPGTDGECLSLVNYQIHLQTDGPADQRTQDIAPLIGTKDACAPPELIWFGDLNRDGYSDALMAVKNRDGARLSLLVSGQESTDIWELADSWTIKDCRP